MSEMFANIVPGLRSQEKVTRKALCHAFDVARNRHQITLTDRSLARSRELNAAVPYARVELGNSLWREFLAHFALSEFQPIPSLPLFYVTPVHVGCITALKASQVPLETFVRQLRRGLRGLSYVGIVDVSLYANVAPGTNCADRSAVNWHLHLFAWGETRKEFKARAKALNNQVENYQPIIPRPRGIGFHWQEVNEENYSRRFRYMCKTPRKAYRIGQTKAVNADGSQVINFKQGKSILRPGQRVTLFNLLKQFSLDQIFVAGGEGVALRRRALRIITRP
jgi:hypothetical protein